MSVIGRGDLLCKNVIIKKLSIKIHYNYFNIFGFH